MNTETNKVTYWACWWRATWVIFVIKCVIGFLSQGGYGLGYAIGSGVIIAPLAGLFWGWIYWLIEK
jgi:hypothetical protein